MDSPVVVLELLVLWYYPFYLTYEEDYYAKGIVVSGDGQKNGGQ